MFWAAHLFTHWHQNSRAHDVQTLRQANSRQPNFNVFSSSKVGRGANYDSGPLPAGMELAMATGPFNVGKLVCPR